VSAVPIFELGFSDAALAILLINFVGIGPVCIFAALGPKFGLRQIVLSRFYFGYYLVKLGRFQAHLAPQGPVGGGK